jgi:hypothetical protein
MILDTVLGFSPVSSASLALDNVLSVRKVSRIIERFTLRTQFWLAVWLCFANQFLVRDDNQKIELVY